MEKCNQLTSLPFKGFKLNASFGYSAKLTNFKVMISKYKMCNNEQPSARTGVDKIPLSLCEDDVQSNEYRHRRVAGSRHHADTHAENCSSRNVKHFTL